MVKFGFQTLPNCCERLDYEKSIPHESIHEDKKNTTYYEDIDIQRKEGVAMKKNRRYISLILALLFMFMMILHSTSYISAKQLAVFSLLFLVYHIVFGDLRIKTVRVKPPAVGELAEEKLMKSKRILGKNIDWLKIGYKESLCYETCHELDYILRLYRERPNVYGPLMYKYEDAFTELASVLEVARKEGLMQKHSLHYQIRELLKYPINDFSDLEKIVDENNQLKIEMELEILNRRIETEIIIAEDIRSMNKGS